MKVSEESLGSGFYLSLFLMLIVTFLWLRLEPRKIESGSLLRHAARRHFPSTDEGIPWVEGVDFPPAEASTRDFAESLCLLKIRARESELTAEAFFQDLLACSLDPHRSLDQRLGCATDATEVNRQLGQRFKSKLGSASRQWPNDFQRKIPTQF